MTTGSSAFAVPDLDALPAMDVAARTARLRNAMGDVVGGCEALLVTDLVNIRWLTGFTGSAARLLVLPDELLFVTDGRYEAQAADQLAAAGVDAVIAIGRTQAAQREVITTAAVGLGRVGLEADAVTWADQRQYATDWFPDAELVPTQALAATLRIEKDDGEIARVEAAAAIATAALDRIRHRLLERPTEADFGLELDTEMRRLGATGPSFETIVASGPNGARPHHRPGGRTITEGDLVVLDFGALVDGYCSDMTRTVAVGELSATQRRMVEVVTEAQRAGVAAMRAGVGCRAVDAACRDVIAAAGWGDAFAHGTGHGVGLVIHEDPRVSAAAPEDATIARRTIVTVEPGVYLPDHGGVRIEDTVVVTDDGCRPLTHAPKDPAWPSRPTTSRTA
ncbi:MAG: aminopeptidase P family protein [Acidimicrobiales bacterium]